MDFGKKKRPVMVEMEQKLLDDKDGAYRKEVINKLLKFDTDINVMLHDANNDSALFERVNRLKTAIQKAKETIERF